MRHQSEYAAVAARAAAGCDTALGALADMAAEDAHPIAPYLALALSGGADHVGQEPPDLCRPKDPNSREPDGFHWGYVVPYSVRGPWSCPSWSVACWGGYGMTLPPSGIGFQWFPRHTHLGDWAKLTLYTRPQPARPATWDYRGFWFRVGRDEMVALAAAAPGTEFALQSARLLSFLEGHP